ncbi:hypothetical protein FOA52_010338 [Chlamydomonas sp. UWO 241]|nr:hypothetical protein FOA52_010338 [Chlamydomonas sp. UWO 241]
MSVTHAGPRAASSWMAASSGQEGREPEAVNSRAGAAPTEKAASQVEYMHLMESRVAPTSGDAQASASTAAPPGGRGAGLPFGSGSRSGPSPTALLRKVSREELRKHKAKDDAWIALKGRVYDITAYLPFHPGGARIVLSSAGRDATELFNKHHRWIDADYLLAASMVGTLEEEDVTK